MTPEQSAQLENMLELVRNCHHEALPRLIGTLRELLATAEMRLHTAMPAPAPCTTDEFLTVKQAAARLGCSKDLLYKRDFPFVRKLGRKKLFSARGIQEYLDNSHS
jgi:hypothetical protein